MASMHSNFFHVQMDKGLIYWPQHSGETWLFDQEEELIYLNAFVEQKGALFKIDIFEFFISLYFPLNAYIVMTNGECL
jgi:hypothetical protein